MKIVRSPNIYKININYFIDNKIKFILCDLDNTLESFDIKSPSEDAKNIIKKFNDLGIKLIICSNNSKERVGRYANELNVPFIYRCFKPSKKKINDYLIKNNINKNDCILIGDQFNTDVKCAIKLNIRCLFSEEIVKKNAFISKFNKFFEKFGIKRAYKKNLIIQMEDKYVIS